MRHVKEHSAVFGSFPFIYMQLNKLKTCVVVFVPKHVMKTYLNSHSFCYNRAVLQYKDGVLQFKCAIVIGHLKQNSPVVVEKEFLSLL